MKISGRLLQGIALLMLLVAGSSEAGLLLEVQGEVRLKRQIWRDFYPVREGLQLSRGELLRLADNASALILCADFATIWRPASGELSGATQGCPVAPDISLFRNGQRASPSRSATAPHLPYIIIPRHTAVSDPHPLLRWNAVPGVERYTVQVIDLRQPRHPVWGPTAVGVTHIRYPEDAPALQPGLTYLVQVESDSGASSPTIGVGFRLVPAERQREIARRRDILQRNIPQARAQQLALAMYYLREQLHSEALGLLDMLVQRRESAPVHLLRARTLIELQLVPAAFQQFEQARLLAAQHRDRETQAEAMVGLAHTSEERASMVRYYQEAMALYQALGDRQRAERLEEELRSVP